MAIVALTSLMSTLELEFLQSTPRPRSRVSLDEDENPTESGLMCCLLKRKPSSPSVSLYGQVKMLHKKLCSLQAFLEKFKRGGGGAKINDLEIKIRDFALKAEDHIEIQISNYLVAKDGGHPQNASQELHQTLREAAKNAAELLEMLNEEDDEVGPENVKLTGSSQSQCFEGRIMVGRHRDRTAIINSLFDEYGERVIAIVGMMGIGKTCLARSIYNHPSVASHFQVRTWITLPQEYQHVDQTLRDLLSSISGVEPQPDEVYISRSLSPLQLEIYQRLARRSCLIVLDNLWDNSGWGHIKDCFPFSLRSRILITTTHFDQKSYADIYCYKHNMAFLDPKESWDLFCNILSPKESMAPKFEKIRSEVLEKCEGLPQLIVEVAKRLSKCNNIQQEWKKIEKEVELLGVLDRTVLARIYNELSNYVNVCFLYFGVFPKRSEISVKTLIRLWVAEGFVKQLEIVAYEYLQELVDRSLVLISSRSSNGKIKTCKMHGSMHTFCVGEAQRGGILCAVNTMQFPGVSLNAFANSCRWLSLYTHSFDYYVLFDTINSRSIFFFHENPEISVPLKLLRVLASVPPPFFRRMQMHFGDFIFLRYISVAQWFEGLEYIVSINSNLQTLVVSGNGSQATVRLPSKIWESPQLRHLELGNSYTVDPPSVDMKSFQTLSWVSPTYCQKEMYNKLPKLKALKIFLKDELELNCICGSCSNPIILDNLDYLVGLEKLTILVAIDCTVTLRNRSIFPFLLKELRLRGLNLSERHLTLIGKLPQLKMLKLENSFHGKVWVVSEGGFCQLGFLHLEAKNLVQLKANKNSFPCLQHLGLKFCYCLEEIPQSFAHIFKLRSIELKQCSPSVVAAAKQILERLDRIRRREFEIKIDGSEYDHMRNHNIHK
ncbi:PREDICTED: putative late blight resistance protein homolog R1A-4 isoform X2 [Ipomoea nil]|uniref:putative late blight resistance protein homolog R1A-4 isoform X2 n=1 Tax=Ipomoea nil TaxID=35883 RepID=UPI00090199EC|nr:PREDICTED: putative late blight resistance protein homolog R1A-4 isoform X2 [Ipomoea nil]